MILGRRHFVAGVAVAPLFLVPKLEAQAPASDPVLDAIIADFQALVREGNEKPSARRGAVRGFETLTGLLAAHLSQAYDPNMKRFLRQQLRQKGRQAFVHEITTRANKPEITHEGIDAMIARFERDGVAGVLRDIQKSIKRVRENAPPDYLQASHREMQYAYCSDLVWQIEMYEFLVALACGLAEGFLGTNPAADAACAGASVGLAAALAVKWWYGC